MFIASERTSQRTSRGVVTTSIPQFVQHSDSQASERLPDTTDTIIKTSPVVDVMTLERHRDPELNPEGGKSTYGVEIS